MSVAACSPSQSMQAMSKMGKIMMDPNTPVGQQNTDKPSTAQITLYADKNANKSEYGDAPVDVIVFQLKDPDELNNADYFSLFENPKGALETSYIRHMKKQVKPGESTVITPFKFTEDTGFIGVAVAYANMDKVTWKAVEKVNATGEQYKILIPVTSKGVSVQVHR
ncbi:type VI secretion system lipoprotein TssJ [Bartonella sp. LJL80]